MKPGLIFRDSGTSRAENQTRFRFLCAILREESKELPSGQAGERLLELARAHRVDRLVAWRTGRVDDGVRAEALLDAVQVRELNRVLAAFDARGVAPLVLKGAALAHTHYEQSWLRPRLDADILIRDRERQRCFDVLRDLGYAQPPFTSGVLVTYQAPFVRTGDLGDEHGIDVHWRVANPQALANLLTYDELASRARAISVHGQPLRTPAPVDALILACVHRAAHHDQADDLLWLYDIHLIAARLAREEWRAFLDVACTRGVSALCAHGVQMAVDRFQTTVPSDIAARLARAGEAPERSALYLRNDLRKVDRLMADLAVLRTRAGLRLVWEHLVPPPDYIRQKYDVPARSWLPAFYARRAVEGMSKWFRRAD